MQDEPWTPLGLAIVLFPLSQKPLRAWEFWWFQAVVDDNTDI